jgi:hypothetical protein
MVREGSVKMREGLAIAQKRLRELHGEVAESSGPVKST